MECKWSFIVQRRTYTRFLLHDVLLSVLHDAVCYVLYYNHVAWCLSVLYVLLCMLYIIKYTYTRYTYTVSLHMIVCLNSNHHQCSIGLVDNGLHIIWPTSQPTSLIVTLDCPGFTVHSTQCLHTLHHWLHVRQQGVHMFLSILILNCSIQYWKWTGTPPTHTVTTHWHGLWA